MKALSKRKRRIRQTRERNLFDAFMRPRAMLRTALRPGKAKVVEQRLQIASWDVLLKPCVRMQGMQGRARRSARADLWVNSPKSVAFFLNSRRARSDAPYLARFEQQRLGCTQSRPWTLSILKSPRGQAAEIREACPTAQTQRPGGPWLRRLGLPQPNEHGIESIRVARSRQALPARQCPRRD